MPSTVLTTPASLPPKCVYCGRTEPRLTKDHVPPKCLFLRPRPQLITVPACHTCNDSYKKDDEYFRLAVTSEAAYRNAAATKLWKGRIAPRMGPGLRSTLLTTMRPAEVRTPGGLVIDRGISMRFDKHRVDRVVERIVRGLLWHHYRSCPIGARFEIYFKLDLHLAPIQDLLSAISLNSIGGNVFRYRYGVTQEDPNTSVWGLQFYGHTHFLILVFSEYFLAQEAIEAARGQAGSEGASN